MMENNRNIAQLARNSKSLEGVGYVDERVMKAIPELYAFARTIGTKKGLWGIYERGNLPHFLDGEEPSDGFCAVYERKGKPRTLFIGELEDVVYVEPVGVQLSRTVLEQRKVFAWPPSRLTARSGSTYSMQQILGGTVLASVAGLGFYFQGNESFLKKIVEYSLSNDINPVTVLFGGTALYLGGVYFGSELLGKKLGELADKTRVKELPQRAFSFSYGPEAEKAVLHDHRTMLEESRKIDLFGTLTKNGIHISKPYFLLLDKAMRSGAGFVEVLRHLQQNPDELNIPLEKLVGVFHR